jgi:N12 class adenine-specific DNA methylase
MPRFNGIPVEENLGGTFGGVPVEEEQPKEQDGALKRGWNKMIQSVGITGALASGDAESAAQKIAESARYQQANPGTPEGNELMAAWQRGDGISGGMSEVAGEFKKDWRAAPSAVQAIRSTGANLAAMGSGVVEQIPNMIPPMTGMLGGGAAGSVVGPVGTVGGAWAGASTGNTLVEGGGMAQEALHKAGINPLDTEAVRSYLAKNGDTILTQAGIKGAVIGAVDVATMGIAGKLLTAPAKAATGRALVDMGVDLTDKAAVQAAIKSPELAAKVAADPLYKAATTGAQGVTRNVTAAALEPAGEFTGEYLGQGLATGEYDEKEAFLEAASSIGQSGATFAGQKAYAALKYPFKADKGSDAPAGGAPGPTADDVLGTPEPTPAAPTEAEKALYTPKNLTALDRVAEIDAKLTNDGQDVDKAEVEALQTERDSITASWPKAMPGATTTFTTEAGARLDGQYALIESGDLTTSHDESLRPVATYPAELQPRERERHASEMQIQQIVGRLDPARLGESADVATGAPIVGADGLVESGNARTIALKRVYQANGQKAIDYKQYLKDNADRFGITAESVDAMQKPVLVRVRNTPVNRAEFARQANQSTVARMSPSEQARADAAQIDSLDDLNPTESGEFSSGSSAPFVRRFMAKLPATEQAGLIDANGQLSQSGYTRIRNAVLAKAYGDSPVLQRMVESLDSNIRNVGTALLRVAPQVAKTREAINEGALHDADLTPDLMAAVEELSSLKDKGTSVTEALAQAGMFGDKLTTESRDLLAFMDENIRSPRRIADFIQSYLDALAAAGNPAQGSMFGDTAAPAKVDLIAAARRLANGEPTATSGAAAGNTADGQAGGKQSENPKGDQAGARGNETSEWLTFPPDTGTLGIPRAEMPQVKGEHRGALIQFLQGRGINHETVDLPANQLKPTQAEFSTKKVEGWVEKREGVDRSVLASSDGYILDGHHQWVAALASGETEKVIRFDVPIQELLSAVREFPSVKKSEGAPKKSKTEVRSEIIEQQWNEALADLGVILRDFAQVARMVPEDTPNLMPTLVKLFEAGFGKVGMQIGDLMKYVKAELRKIPEFSKVWNKLSPATYRKAAAQALENHQAAPQGDLFAPMVEKAQQGDLFSGKPVEKVVAGKAVMIDGRPYKYREGNDHGDNFDPGSVDNYIAADVLERADEYVRKYYSEKADPVITKEERERALVLLNPLIKRAEAAKASYDQKVVDIAKRAGAIGQQLAPVKGLKRAIPKLVKEEKFDIEGMKDMLRSTIVVSSYEDAQRVVDEIEKEFELLRAPKNRTSDTPLRSRGKDIAPEDRRKYGGYADVLVNVILPGDVIAEIQINIPSMLSAKEAQGHKLYEAFRDAPKDSPLGREINEAMQEFYAAAFAARRSADSFQAAAELRKAASSDGKSDSGRGKPLGTNSPESEIPNTLPSGNTTLSSPPTESKNSQPAGNLSGTFISTTSTTNIAQEGNPSYTGSGKRAGESNGQSDGNNGSTSAQGQSSGSASATDGGGDAAGVRGGPSRGNRRSDRDADNADGAEDGARQGQESDGGRGDTEGMRGDGNGNRAGRDAAIPAGRDIPAKSGLNYAFGDGDLTYAGGWLKKATQNVDAVDLVKKLETEKRQATREEQSVLAKFIGWGASELANSIFGKTLDKQIEAISNYEDASKYLDESLYGGLRQRDRGYYQAFQVLAASDPKTYSQHSYYSIEKITKQMLEKARPDMGAKKWASLRDRLKAVMTESEWKDASKSTKYAHYTSKPVVQSIFSAVSKMGFKGGTILEPGAGIGVFPGLMPAEMATNSIYTGIEYDPITGGILKQLMPDERILVESFIDSKLPENFYDVAIGNPPFSGDVTVLADPKYVKHAFKLHDYFFAKTIDSVKPGGLVVFVTSRFTMDKKADKARAFMAERADLVGAIRLPQTAFQKNAGTEVVTDVLFLRKKVPGETFAQAQAWSGLSEVKTEKGSAPVNEYFAAHPEMVLGSHSHKGSMYGPDQYTVLPREGDIEAHFAAAVENLPADVFVAGRGSAAEAARVREMDFNPKAKKEGSFYVTDAGVLMQREGGVGVRADAKHQKNAEVIKDYVSLRDAVKQTQFDQLNDGDWESSLKALQKAYADFNGKHGRLLQNTTYMQKVKVDELDEDGTPTGNKVDDEEQRRRFPLLSKLKADAEWTLVAELERLNEDTGEVTDSKWLAERTLNKPTVAEVKTPADALLAVLNDTGRIDIAAVADRVGLSEQETVDSLGTLIYEDPAQGWVMADEYLSGNVKKKLAQAEEAAKSDKAYARNVEALKEVQPAPRSPEQITPQIGMNWIPGDVYEQFLNDVTGVRAKIEYVKRTREWVLTTLGGEGTPQATSDWGVGDKAHAGWLMDKALSGAAISLNKSVSDGKGGSKQVFDPDRTEAANQKRAELRAKFREWLFQDAQRTTDLVQLYNDKFNTNVQRKFDGRHLTLPGTSKLFKIFDHVKRGAWRVIQTGNTYLAHAVGSGKTFEMVISAMEQKRLGLIKKPLIIVPGHMLQQFASEWQQLYPTARLMVADETDFHTDNRRRFVSRVAMSDLDGVIMTHSSFGLLDLDPVFKQKMLEQELDVLRASYEEAGGDLDEIGDKKVRKEPKIKRIEAQIEKLEQQLAKAMSSEGKDKNVRFDEMGIDFLYVDEAHLFRKLSFATARDTKGIDPNGSQMAWDLYMKTRWLAEKNPNRYMVMASGTAITNTTAELYTVQRYMAPQVLEENGLAGFDDWASQFGEESTTIESTASGKYEPVTRFQNFVNVGEMTQMFRDFADVLNEDHLAALLGDARPKVKGGARKSIITPKTAAYAEFLKDVLGPRIATSRAWKPTFEEKYNPDPIIAINIDARLAAIDMRFMDPTLPSDPDSKLNQMIDGVIRIYKETENNEYRGKSTKDKDGNEVLADFEAIKGATQMVFFESGFGKMVAQRRGFNARAWMEKRLRDAGIPTNQLAFMEDYKKSSAKLKLFSDVNKGKVRVLVGSSAAMGTGVNAQQRLIALHHLDAPYVPATLEQREGRIVRQGNKNPEVQIYAYSMFGSFDENMWSMLARKKFFIEQAMSGDPNIRSIEDVGEVNQLQIAAGLVAENPFVLQHAGAKAEVEKLTRLYRNHEEQRARHRADYENAGRTIDYNEQWLPAAEKEAAKVKDLHGDAFTAKADGKAFDKRKEWGEAILAKAKDLSDKLAESRAKVGEISGFDVMFVGGMTGGQYVSRLDLQLPMPVAMAHGGIADPSGMATRAVNALVELQRKPDAMRKIIAEAQSKRQALESRLEAAFPLAEQLANKIKETADFEQKMLSYGKEAKPGLFNADDFANPTTMFSRGTGIGMALRDLQAVVDRIAKGFKNLPRVHVLSSPSDLSTKDPAQKALRDFIKKSGAWDDVEGATHEGEIYLFASGMADEARAEFVLAEHEVTHYGLRGTMGKELDSALQHIYLFNGKVRVAADKMKKARGLKSNVEAVEEVLADMPSADLAKLRGWRKVVQVVRNWLNKAGAKNLAARLDAWMKAGLTDQEKADLFVADLVGAARQWVKSGKNVSSGIMGGTRLADPRLADDLAAQEKWLEREAKMRGFKSIDELAEKDYPAFENLAALWRKKNPVEHAMLSRAKPVDIRGSQTADDIIGKQAGTPRPLDAMLKVATKAVGLPKLTTAIYNKAAFFLDRFTPDTIKAGMVSDYGIPDAVIDARAVMEGRQRQQLRGAGKLLEKLSTLTRAESRVAYEWMSNDDPQAADYFEKQLPEESVKVLKEVRDLIDQLSQEAIRLGQLSPEAYDRNKFAYLRRSYVKHTAELTKGETKGRARAISILGDQYKGRGMTDAVDMAKFKAIAPEWWNRKLKAGQADKQLKGEKFIRLERRAPIGTGTTPLDGMTGPQPKKQRLLEVAYWPAGETIPARYGSWDQAGTWEVRDTKGGKLVVWRDFTKQEREAMGEIDEARYAIAKTLHGMIHDVEVGKYLEWLGQKYAKKEGEQIDGEIVEASERMRDTFKPGEWVQVPDTKIPGTQVKKYGTLAGRYIPGPIWNDVRQIMGGQFKPLGDTYAAIHRAWKTSKTALSPAVHMNNVMANFVMADWHDVTAGHILKALKLMVSKDPAAADVLSRFGDSGGTIGTWATKELQQEQLRPLLEALEKELGIAGNVSGQVGVMSALQLALKGKMSEAWASFTPSKTGQVLVKAARALIDLYEAEDQVFRLAAWLKAKEEGASDLQAGKAARKSFLDYSINAPWVQMMRGTAFPFIAFTYRSVPMLLDVAAKKPWKLMKLGMVFGAINALGYMLSGGDEDDERKLLPEEKAGRIWGITPKLVRMPWNDANGAPVFLDVRRWIPVGDIFDTGATHAALPILPMMQPGGPLMLLAEFSLDKTGFTGKGITLETDTPVEKATKTADWLYKAFAPNIAVLPGTYAWTAIANAGGGKTDSFGRELSLTQAIVSSVGIKVGSYPKDVLQLNAQREAQAKMMEIDRNITALKREYQKRGIEADEYQEKAADQMAKKRKIVEKLQGRMAGG